MSDMQSLDLSDKSPEAVFIQIEEQITEAISSLLAIKNIDCEMPIKNLVTSLGNALRYTYYSIKEYLFPTESPEAILKTRAFRNYTLAEHELSELMNEYTESNLLEHLDDAITSLRSSLITQEDDDIMEAVIYLNPASRSIINALHVFSE